MNWVPYPDGSLTIIAQIEKTIYFTISVCILLNLFAAISLDTYKGL